MFNKLINKIKKLYNKFIYNRTLKEFNKLNTANVTFIPSKSLTALIYQNEQLKNYKVLRLLNHAKTPSFHKLDIKLLCMIDQANSHAGTDLGWTGYNYIMPIQHNISKRVQKILCDFSTNNYIVFNQGITAQDFNTIVTTINKLFSDKYASKVTRLVYIHSLGLINDDAVKGNKINRVVRNLKTLSNLKLKSELRLFKNQNIFYINY